jgi:hypothetical protein
MGSICSPGRTYAPHTKVEARGRIRDEVHRIHCVHLEDVYRGCDRQRQSDQKEEQEGGKEDRKRRQGYHEMLLQWTGNLESTDIQRNHHVRLQRIRERTRCKKTRRAKHNRLGLMVGKALTLGRAAGALHSQTAETILVVTGGVLD